MEVINMELFAKILINGIVFILFILAILATLGSLCHIIFPHRPNKK